jgi:hypothetical protein
MFEISKSGIGKPDILLAEDSDHHRVGRWDDSFFWSEEQAYAVGNQ